MPTSESFAHQLKTYRRRNGLTQKGLAEQWNYSHEAISSWEREKRTPNGQEIPRLARLLGMKPEELVECIDYTRPRVETQRNHPPVSEEADPTDAPEELLHIYGNRTDFSSNFSYPRMFEHARDILAVGISLNGIALTYSSEKIINLVLKKEATITLCFLDPRGRYCAEREQEEQLVAGRLATLTQFNINTMKNVYAVLKKRNPAGASRLKLLTYDVPVRFNIYVVDDACLTVQSYAYGRGEDTPTFVLKRQSRDGLFDFYASAARHVLSHAKPIDMEVVP